MCYLDDRLAKTTELRELADEANQLKVRVQAHNGQTNAASSTGSRQYARNEGATGNSRDGCLIIKKYYPLFDEVERRSNRIEDVNR